MNRTNVIAVNALVCLQGYVVSAIERGGGDIPQQNTALMQKYRDYTLGLGSWKIELLYCLSHNAAAAHGVAI
jgi:hypothetical protein